MRYKCINAETGTRYLPSVAVLNAADYGVPQRRRRLMIVASRDGVPSSFQSRATLPSQLNGRAPTANHSGRPGMRSGTYLAFPMGTLLLVDVGRTCWPLFQRDRTISGTPIAAEDSRSLAGAAVTGHSYSSLLRINPLGRSRPSQAQPRGHFTGTVGSLARANSAAYKRSLICGFGRSLSISRTTPNADLHCLMRYQTKSFAIHVVSYSRIASSTFQVDSGAG